MKQERPREFHVEIQNVHSAVHSCAGQINRIKLGDDRITVICVPTLDQRGLLADISVHFGKTPYFTFIKFDEGEIKDINVVESFSKHKGGSKTPSEIILDLGADILYVEI